jgi:hypothetical protein
MSKINVDTIVNKTDSGPPTFTRGFTVGAGYALTAFGGVTIDGTVTATSFVGDGSGITNLPVSSAGKLLAIKRILVFDDYRF